MAKGIIFFDGDCGFCDRSVRFFLKADRKGLFCFAPLRGLTAQAELDSTLLSAGSIVLLEKTATPPRVSLRSKAVFRAFWLLGGFWICIGWLSFLPSILFDWAYRLIANNRSRLMPPPECSLPSSLPEGQRGRFLP